MRRANILIAAFVCFLFLGCNKNADKSSSSPALPEKVDPNIIKFKYIYSLMSPRFKTEVKIDDEHILDFVAQIESLIANDSDNLLTFCSKEKLLPSSYVPDDLIKLSSGKTYAINRNDLILPFRYGGRGVKRRSYAYRQFFLPLVWLSGKFIRTQCTAARTSGGGSGICKTGRKSASVGTCRRFRKCYGCLRSYKTG